MTSPFTTVTDKQETGDKQYLPVSRCKGKLLIVRPLDYQKEGFVTAHAPEGTDVVFIDAALLDPIAEAVNEDDETLPGFAAETEFRGQAILQAYLKGTFKRYIGQTLIGTIYKGVPTKGKPPLMWQDLTGDPGCVARGQAFLATHPQFLIPVEAHIVTSVPEVPAGPPPYTPPLATGGVVTSPPLNTLDQMRRMANGGTVEAPF